MKTKYPWQVDSIIHRSSTTKKTLGIDALLFSPKESDDDRTPTPPLQMHEGYSRFKGTLIVKDKKAAKFVSFNIPAEDIPYIHEMTKQLMTVSLNKKMQGTVNAEKNTEGNNELSSHKAFTEKFIMGNLKGKTPGQILSENDSNVDVLKKQREFLVKNLKGHENNQKLIDAIDDAFALKEEGKLEKLSESRTTTASSEITVYSCEPKNIKPLDAEGRYTVYQISVTYNPSMNLPYCVNVMNCFAPVETKDGNKIIMSKAVNKQEFNIRVSEQEWFKMIDRMLAQKNLFESMTYPEQIKLAAKISKDNYDEAKKNAEKENESE